MDGKENIWRVMDYYSHLPGFRRHENGSHVFAADNREGKLTAMDRPQTSLKVWMMWSGWN